MSNDKQPDESGSKQLVWLVAMITVFLSVIVGTAVLAAYRDVEATQARRKQMVQLPKTKDEWKKVLSRQQYHVTREKGTEIAFSGKYWGSKEPGVYKCVCCTSALFSSKDKFDSGTGWPSFSSPISDNQVGELKDSSLLMSRTEVVCKKCDAHLGHVFDDGPAPTNKRFCINSASLDFEKREQE